MEEYIKREASCEDCIHKDICDSWEKEVYPNDCPPWDGTPCISFMPAADVVERKRGKWEQHGRKWQCSCCGVLMDIDGTPEENLLHFCPNCGADMRGENNG